MEGIEKITAKIIEDSEAEITKLLEETDEKVRAIGESAQAQADQETADAMARGKRAADERLERLSSAAKMETRKLELATKQEMLAKAFALAQEKLCSLPDQEYIQLLSALVLEASSSGKEQLVFSAKDRARVGKQVVVAANEALVKRVSPELPESITDTKLGAFLGRVVNSTTAVITGKGLLTLSESTRPIQGGFIMVDGDVEINCAFETLVRLQREKLEREVAQILFA